MAIMRGAAYGAFDVFERLVVMTGTEEPLDVVVNSLRVDRGMTSAQSRGGRGNCSRWGRMASCRGVGNRRCPVTHNTSGRLPIGQQLNKLPHNAAQLQPKQASA